ncbi:ricin-type beta-trefoil lectin domain protein [Streptomyces sp. Tue6028]|uniref:ricin-type beta-trefoil lectin domain protein n=1 Tax=Streptomyces sp. Tue6028 TaxID=2036037 RepID=UPI003D7127DE
MAGAGRTDAEDTGDEAGGEGMFATASDAQLTELLRADTPTAYPALRELRLRHRTAVHAYARMCTAGEAAARQLTAQAFALAARDTALGSDPRGPWRHQLLLLVGQVAASWATGERASRLDPDLLGRLLQAGPDGPVPSMLDAFESLPTRVQGLVWYGVVDEEPDERTATLLGITPQDVTYGRGPAFQALRQACLKTRLARSGNPRCQDFRRLIEEAAHPESPRYSADLHAHMAHCGHCAAAYEELGALRDTPREALAEGLLPWGGAALVGGLDGEPRTAPAARGGRAGLPARRLVLVSAALGVAAAPLLLFLLTSGGSDPAPTAGTVRTPEAPPPVTVTATVSASASPSPSATSRRPGRPPTPSPAAKPSKTPAKTPKPSPSRSAFSPPDGTFAQVVNVGSGRCLDIRDGDLDRGTDVITARCTSSPTQMWRVDTDRDVLQSYADPDYCLDSRGDTDRGVGIWECDSVYGSHGQNLRFTVDGDGVIRPAIAPDHAVTPDGYGLALFTAEGGDDQRWRAGATAT